MTTRDNGVPEDLCVSKLEAEGSTLVVFSWSATRGVQPSNLMGASAGPAAAPLPDLTAAERAVHALLVAGLSDAEIAELRGTTRSTVTKQVDAVFRKLGVRSRRELLARR